MIVEDEHAPLPQTNIQFCSPARPHTYVVGPGRLRRWEFMILPGESADEVNRQSRIWELLSPWLRPDQARLWRSATYTFHALVAEKWRTDRVFLAGDACHMTPPFLAQGMVQGIKDTANLSWKLAHALRGGSERLLDTYEAERRSLVREVIEITKRLGRVICELDPEKARARDAELIAAMEAGQGVQIRQNLFPPIRHGLVGRAANGSLLPGAGEPCPQPWVVGPGGRARLDDMLPGGFILLLAGDIDLPPALIGQAWEMGVAVHRISRTPSEHPQLIGGGWPACQLAVGERGVRRSCTSRPYGVRDRRRRSSGQRTIARIARRPGSLSRPARDLHPPHARSVMAPARGTSGNGQGRSRGCRLIRDQERSPMQAAASRSCNCGHRSSHRRQAGYCP